MEYKDKIKTNEPPIGLMPRKRWIEIRIKELVMAIVRYTDDGYIIPSRFAKELGEHLEYMEQLRQKKG